MKKKYKLIKSILLLIKSLDFRRKYQFIGILLVNIINGLFEFISIGSALLFLESLIDPNKTLQSFSFVISYFRINKNSDLITLTTLIFLSITLITTLIRIINLWLNTKFRISFLNYISNKLYRKLITQDYSYYINSNSSELLTDITANIQKTNFFFENLLTLITSIILSISIIISLLKLNIYITFTSVLVFTSLYTFLGLFINKEVNKYSKIEMVANTNLIKTIQDSFNAIKEIIISNNQIFYINNFAKNNNNLREYQGLSGFITTFPRYLFEGIGLLFIGISGYLIYNNINNSSNIIALLGAFALGCQKLLPSMQSSYKSWSLLYFYDKGLNRILNLLKLEESKNLIVRGKLSFKKAINIKNLHFFYSNDNKNISKNINLIIKKGENIGIFGKTGSGKTTLVNILMGILYPVKGNIYIDNENLFENHDINILKKWRNNISHVPQEVFLYDSSILENIALCIPKKEINLERAINAAKTSHAHEFIIKTINGYETIVGEKGIKLSGGQKQRLGLARALYNNSELLILDESTSALDFKTEKLVIESIYAKKSINSLTTITIAHRLSTLSYCDKVIELKNGSIYNIYDHKTFLEKFQNHF